MDSGLQKTIGLAAITAVITVFVARADGPVPRQPREAAGTLAADSMRRDSAVPPKWLNDATVLALVGTMNARQISAADVELSSWHSDTVRAFAATMARDHAELQRSADSLAAALKIAAVPSALSAEVNAVFQAQIDSMPRGMSLDRAFVREQVASHQLMADYIRQLSGAAHAPEMQAWLATFATRVDAQIARANALNAQFAVADSVAADSLAKRAARRTRRDSTR